MFVQRDTANQAVAWGPTLTMPDGSIVTVGDPTPAGWVTGRCSVEMSPTSIRSKPSAAWDKEG